MPNRFASKESRVSLNPGVPRRSMHKSVSSPSSAKMAPYLSPMPGLSVSRKAFTGSVPKKRKRSLFTVTFLTSRLLLVTRLKDCAGSACALCRSAFRHRFRVRLHRFRVRLVFWFGFWFGFRLVVVLVVGTRRWTTRAPSQFFSFDSRLPTIHGRLLGGEPL